MNFSIPYNPPPEFSFFADQFYERLEEHLHEIQNGLDEDEQVLVLLATGSEMIMVDSFGYHNPTLLIAYGTDSTGNGCTVFTNVAAAQVIVKVVKAEEDKEKRAIGFLGEVGE